MAKGRDFHKTYLMDFSGKKGDLSENEIRYIIVHAMTKWSQVSPFSFQSVSNKNDANIVFRFGRIDDTRHPLAHADTENGEIVFDQSINWYDWNKRGIQPGDPFLLSLFKPIILAISKNYDLLSVAVHEIGHFLGLARNGQHSTAPNSVMQAKLNIGGCFITNGGIIPQVDVDDLVQANRELYAKFFQELGGKYWWRRADGFQHVSTSGDQSIWAVGQDGHIYVFGSEQKFEKVTTDGIRFTEVLSYNRYEAWALRQRGPNEFGQELRHIDIETGKTSSVSPGNISAVVGGVRGLHVLIHSNKVMRFHGEWSSRRGNMKGHWRDLPAAPVQLVRLAVGCLPLAVGQTELTEEVWGLAADGSIVRHASGSAVWDRVPGVLSSLGAGYDGTVMGTNKAGEIYRLSRTGPNPSDWSWTRTADGRLSTISVRDCNTVWGVNGTREVYSSRPH